MTTTTIRIDYSTLPEGFDLSRPDWTCTGFVPVRCSC